MSIIRNAARAAGAGVLLTAAAVQGFTRYVTRGNRQTLEEAIRWQGEHYDISFFDSLEKEEYTVKGYEDYILHVVFCKNPRPSKKYVILTHGHTDNRYGMLKYMKIYLDLGYNCIIYDLRGHGLNKRDWCSYGLRESRDLVRLIEDTYRRYGKDIYLGLHGESLGAGTTVAVLEKKPPVDFAVVDCGFYDMVPVFEVAIRSYHLPVFMVKVASACAKVIYGYSFRQMRPIEALPDNQVPLLFMHGSCDELVSPEHSRKMSKATAGYSEVHMIPNAGHADAVFTF